LCSFVLLLNIRVCLRFTAAAAAELPT